MERLKNMPAFRINLWAHVRPDSRLAYGSTNWGPIPVGF